MPKIITSLNELRSSGRMCSAGWSTLLTGLGKVKGDDEPLDVLTCLSICGHHDTLWHFPNWMQHGDAYRSLAVSFAREVTHLAADPAAAELILCRVTANLRGEASWLDMMEAVPSPFELREYADCSQERAAMSAAVATAITAPWFAPKGAAYYAEEAEAKAEAQHHTASRQRAEARNAELLWEFLSGR